MGISFATKERGINNGRLGLMEDHGLAHGLIAGGRISHEPT
jgi:hypothetical protein